MAKPKEQKHDSRARILTDPQGFCLGHRKLTIKSHNKSKGSVDNTVIKDPSHLGNTREQKQGSKAWILTDPLGFCLGHPKITIKSQNKTTGTRHKTENTDARPRGHTKEQTHGSKARILGVFAVVTPKSPSNQKTSP